MTIKYIQEGLQIEELYNLPCVFLPKKDVGIFSFVDVYLIIIAFVRKIKIHSYTY